jgi:phosphoglycerate kinase
MVQAEVFGPAAPVRTQKEGAGMMKTIRDVEISGKRLLIRVDFNVPLDEYQNITDDARIRGVLPTIQYALDHNAMVILASHLGRPKGKAVPEFSLKPVAKRLGRLLGTEVAMAEDCVGDGVREQVQAMKPGDVLLLENLRYHAEEQANDGDFGKALADLCDIYVNDAFAVSHRVNASVVSVTQFAETCVAGFLLQKELDYFAKAMKDPRRPLVAIVGGAKVSSKLKAMENMLDHVDKLIIGGAMANTFLKRKGLDVGKSKVEEDLLDSAGALMDRAAERGVRLYLPVDVVAASRFDADAESIIVPAPEIPPDWMALDIGPATSLLYSEALYNAKTIIWNGPMGVFEMDAFSRGTLRMVETVADSYALTIVGGGDTDVAIHKAGEVERISYISTGGGAFLTLMEGKPLPAVKALDSANGG